MAWFDRRTNRLRYRNGGRHDDNLTRTKASRGLSKKGRCSDHNPRAPKQQSSQKWRTPRQFKIGSPHLNDERASREQAGKCRGEPVGVYDIGAAGRSPSGAHKVREEERQQEAP